MFNDFKFKGVSAQSMDVYVDEITTILGRAPQRVEVISYEGRDGSTIIPLGYESINRTLNLYLTDPQKLDLIMEWLNGAGEFEYKGRITQASFYSSFEPERSSSIYKVKVDFTRDPFWFKKDDSFSLPIKNATNKFAIENEGNQMSKPIIRLTKITDSSVEVRISGIRFKYNFAEPFVLIDCEKKNATYEGLSRNRNLEIGFEFPKLTPGHNFLEILSGGAKIEFLRKDVWL